MSTIYIVNAYSLRFIIYVLVKASAVSIENKVNKCNVYRYCIRKIQFIPDFSMSTF